MKKYYHIGAVLTYFFYDIDIDLKKTILKEHLILYPYVYTLN